MDGTLNKQRQITRLLAFVLLYTLLAGAVRKWIVLSGPISNVLLLGHILLPWLFYMLAPGRKGRYTPVLLLFGALLLLMAFNPLNQSLFHGAFGLLLHLGFWLFAFHYLENRHLYVWENLFSLLIVLFFVEVVLGIFQYSLPRTHFINRYAAETATSIAYVGERARVTGTFSYVAGFTSWLFFANLWIWSLALQRRSLRLVVLLTALAVFASLISGARMALALTLLFACLMFWGVLKRLSVLKVSVALLVGVLAAAGAYQKSAFVQEAWSNFYSRIEDGIRDEEFGRRTVGVVEEIIDYRGDYPVFGTGLGATYQGARIIWGESYFIKRYGGFEEEPERIVLEGGYLLFILRTLLVFYFLSRLRLPFLYKILFGLLIILFTHSIFNVYNLVFVPLGLSLLDQAYPKPETRLE
ncbi:MAG: hypothetical protein IPM98_14405 [Lewinellaceae bacterium]|nr:hypothetical protein [Lewinellaceae bacterium]